MKELSFKMPERYNIWRGARSIKNIESLLLGVILLLVCITLHNFMIRFGYRDMMLDPNIWLLIPISLLCFLLVVAMSWWLLQRGWRAMGLPGINVMVLLFKDLQGWQQLGFFFASFTLLLLAGIGALVAVL